MIGPIGIPNAVAALSRASIEAPSVKSKSASFM